MTEKKPNLDSFSCPVPKSDYTNVQLSHGSGGKLSRDLVNELFVEAFDNPILRELDDQAKLTVGEQRLAFTTDSYVVDPLFFPGGDIGELAVNGTVNDLAMSGARPLYLSAGFIIEEGLSFDDLCRVVLSMGRAAEQAGVQIVTGDTKVVNHGKADRLFINTAGIGLIEHSFTIGANNLQPGDVLIVSGTIADH
ncbi:MAG: hydrogenase expression/formation protein HypE, partial [Candidatus Zixiibacteriota bacterium]